MVKGCRGGLFLPRDTLDTGVGGIGMPFLYKAGSMEGIWFGVGRGRIAGSGPLFRQCRMKLVTQGVVYVGWDGPTGTGLKAMGAVQAPHFHMRCCLAGYTVGSSAKARLLPAEHGPTCTHT